jgi:hypothetical protein
MPVSINLRVHCCCARLHPDPCARDRDYEKVAELVYNVDGSIKTLEP